MLFQRLATELGADVVATAPVAGGDVNEAFRVDLGDGRRVFAKTHRNPPPGFYETEASGLRWLAEAHAVNVAIPLAWADDPPPFLALGWIDEGMLLPGGDEDFGRRLADLHRAGAPCFGRTDGATTGSRRLPNEPCDSWAEFYATRRLEPLRRLAAEGQAIGRASLARLDEVIARIDGLVGPVEAPARLHGDLWAGNRLVDGDGASWLIDPAAHGGHREFDLAMMLLFGGFGQACFAAYDEVNPLDDGWSDRVPLHQLAPLVVHAIKFGGPYVPAVDHALDRIL